MTRLLILGIILINALTLYYAKYHTISDQDASAYVLAEQLLKKNNQIMDITNDGIQQQIYNKAQAYYKFKEQANQADSIRKAYYQINRILGDILNEIEANYQHLSEKENGQIERMKSQSLNYSFAQKTLIKNGWLDSLIQTIATEQEFIEQTIQEDSVKTKWAAQFQLNTATIKEQLTGKSVQHTCFELHFIRQHCKEATHFLLQPIFESIVESYNFDAVFPTVHAKNDFIQLGETYEADIHLANYAIPISDTLMEMKVNGQVIPMEKGIGLYEIKANKVGKKTYTAECIFKNPITGKIDTYKREFEYEVIDCK